MDAAFAELVECKNDTITVRFEKASLKFFLTQDYFEAFSKTHLKAKISDNQGKVEITFDVRNKKDYEILEELKIFGLTFMEIKEFIENFANQFDDTDVSAFSAETRFRELDEWSSLLALSVLAMVDEEYDVQLKADQMRKANTVQELFDIVKSLKD